MHGVEEQQALQPPARLGIRRVALDHGAVVVRAVPHRARTHAAHRHVDIALAIQAHAGQALEAQRPHAARARPVAGAVGAAALAQLTRRGHGVAVHLEPEQVLVRTVVGDQQAAVHAHRHVHRQGTGRQRHLRGALAVGVEAHHLPALRARRAQDHPQVAGAIRRHLARLLGLPGAQPAHGAGVEAVDAVAQRRGRVQHVVLHSQAAHRGVLALAHGGDAQEAVQHRARVHVVRIAHAALERRAALQAVEFAPHQAEPDRVLLRIAGPVGQLAAGILDARRREGIAVAHGNRVAAEVAPAVRVVAHALDLAVADQRDFAAGLVPLRIGHHHAFRRDGDVLHGVGHPAAIAKPQRIADPGRAVVEPRRPGRCHGCAQQQEGDQPQRGEEGTQTCLAWPGHARGRHPVRISHRATPQSRRAGRHARAGTHRRPRRTTSPRRPWPAPAPRSPAAPRGTGRPRTARR
ncbi:hypothetical protein D3C81_921160 [compost metagenome]